MEQIYIFAMFGLSRFDFAKFDLAKFVLSKFVFANIGLSKFNYVLSG